MSESVRIAIVPARCTKPGCKYPNTNIKTHQKEYHSNFHSFMFNGKKEKVFRRSDGKIPCPCGEELHARYNWKKVGYMCDKTPHPEADASEWNDLPIGDSEEEKTGMNEDHIHEDGNEEMIESRRHLDREQVEVSEGVEGGYMRSERMEALTEVGAKERDTDIAEDSEGEEDGGLDEGESEYEEADDAYMEPDDNPPSTPSSIEDTRVYLFRFNISVDSIYHLTICTECATPVEHIHIYSHQRLNHFQHKNIPTESRLPSPNELYSRIAVLGGFHPMDVPIGPVPPIQGVKIIPGFKCTLEGCEGSVHTHRDSLRKHQRSIHPSIATPERTFVSVHCQPLSLFRNKRRYVEVIPQDTAYIGIKHILSAAECCNLLVHGDVFTAVSNEREKNYVLAQTRWDEELVGVQCSLLISAVSPSEHSKHQGFTRLRRLCREYYEDTVEQISKLPILTRRYILSANPSSQLKDQPFRRPQEMGTVVRDADCISQLISFLIITNELPIPNYII